MRLLALDLSTNCGWSLFEKGKGAPRFGTFKLPPAPEGEHERRFVTLFEWLHDMRSLHQFDALAFERPILPRKSGDLATTMHTLTLLWVLATVVQLFAGLQAMRCIPVPVQAAKFALTGKKNATKDEMVAAAMNVVNWKIKSHHEADAGSVGVYAYGVLFP